MSRTTYESTNAFIAVIKDDDVIAIFDVHDVARYKEGYMDAGGDTDDLSFHKIDKITIAK